MDTSNEPAPRDAVDRECRCGRWRATIGLSLVGLAIPGVLAVYMWVSGSGPRSTVEDWVDQIIVVAYLAGSIAAFLFGNLLAHPDDPVHIWNAFLFYSGGLLSWTLVGAFIGFLIDLSRRRNRSTNIDPSGHPAKATS